MSRFFQWLLAWLTPDDAMINRYVDAELLGIRSR